MFYTWEGAFNRYVAHLSWPSPTRMDMSSRMMLGSWSMAKPSMWPNGSPSILEENKPSWHTSERTGQRPFFVFVLVASNWLGRTQLIKLDVKGKWRILNPKGLLCAFGCEAIWSRGDLKWCHSRPMATETYIGSMQNTRTQMKWLVSYTLKLWLYPFRILRIFPNSFVTTNNLVTSILDSCTPTMDLQPSPLWSTTVHGHRNFAFLGA